MRIGVVVVMISLAASLPAPLLADPDSSGSSASAQAAPAAAETQQAAPPAGAKETVVVQPQAASNLDEIVCRTSPPTTGTRLGASRECHTERDWNRRQADAQRQLQATQAMGLEGHAGPKGN